MKHKNTAMVLGIVSMILLALQFANAQSYDKGAEKYINIKYTKGGYIACRDGSDFDLAKAFVMQGDKVALSKMIKEGKCIELKQNTPVYIMGDYKLLGEIIIRPQGSTESYLTYREAVIMEGGKDQERKGSPMSMGEWLVLKSFLWIKAGKTTRQEIIQKYPDPKLRDETGGEYAYYGDQYTDFKEWEEISFIFDGNVLDEIRAQKKKE